MYKVVKLQNASNFDSTSKPTIEIKIGDVDWEEAYNSWVNSKTPTASPEWKKGVFAIMGLCDNSKE